MKKEIIIVLLIILSLILILFIFVTKKIPLNLNKDIIEINQKSEEGILSLGFDDGYLSQYTIAYPLMKKYSLNGTLYIMANLTNSFYARELMSFENAREMQDAGWEIGSHSLEHKSLIKLSSEELNDDLFLSKQILEGKGLQIHSIAFPYGRYNSEVIAKTKKYYSSARTFFWGYNKLNRIRAYFLRVKWVKRTDSSEKICSWIKHAEKEKLWLILVFHHINEKEERAYDLSKIKFKSILECINKTQIQVKTISEVVG